MTRDQRRLLEAIAREPGRVFHVTFSGSITLGHSSKRGYHVPEQEWGSACDSDWIVIHACGGETVVAGITPKGRKALEEQ